MPDEPPENKEKYALESWKTAVAVQQHFNTIEMQIRNIAVTVLTATVAAAGIIRVQSLRNVADAAAAGKVLPETNLIHVAGWELNAAQVILFGGLMAWVAFYLMDKLWYHRLLHGAVDHGLAVERFFKESGYGDIMDLTTSIGRTSPLKIGPLKIHSGRKLDLFYLLVAAFIVAMILAM